MINRFTRFSTLVFVSASETGLFLSDMYEKIRFVWIEVFFKIAICRN